MIALLAMACLGQTPTFMAYDLRVKHEVLQPGQVQEIEVWASYTPGGTPVYQNLKVLTFYACEFDILNTHDFETGTISAWSAKSGPGISPGTAGPDGGFVRALAAQFYWGSFNGSNPIHMMTYFWTPDPLLGPRTVEIATQVRGDYFHNIWLIQYPPNFPSYVQWETTEVFNDSVSWKVIPAPAAALVLLAPLGGRRRRRASR